MDKKNTQKYIYARGRRKSSVATVRLFAEKGESTINEKKVGELYSSKSDKKLLNLAFDVSDLSGNFYFTAQVFGGGKSGQRDAIKLALARALIRFDPSCKSAIKKAGLLTRDPRKKERKKPGLKKARKREQFSKR